MLFKYISVGFCILYVANFSSAQFQGEALRFKLSAVNLPNCDLDGPSDPFVKLYSRRPGRSGERHHDWELFGRSSVKVDTLNPEWDEVFVYQYINGTNQRWRFMVKDQDDTWLNPWDDPLGRVEVNVEDYLLEMRRSKQNQTGPYLKPIQMFLTEPIGGAILIKPIVE